MNFNRFDNFQWPSAVDVFLQLRDASDDAFIGLPRSSSGREKLLHGEMEKQIIA